jgi:hypothetical protein
MDSQPKRAPWFWPLILVIGGVVVLLDNFLLIDVDIARYWPVLLLALGIQLLLHGDIAPSWQAHTFGITRGSVESASIEIESGELDVQLRALRKPGRLIAGQYTARSRPDLTVRHNHATLRMQRGQSWWLSLAYWDVGLANDLPWEVLMSSYLGHLEADLRDLLIQRVYMSSGIGNVSLICPHRAAGMIFARSTFGDVQLTIPDHSRAQIVIKTGPFGRVRVNEARFTQVEPGVYASPPKGAGETANNTDTPELTVIAGTVFGSVYIS